MNHGLTFGDVPDALAVSRATVARWLDLYGPAIIAAHREARWPERVVLESTEFLSAWLSMLRPPARRARPGRL